jgi:hypothetical protein
MQDRLRVISRVTAVAVVILPLGGVAGCACPRPAGAPALVANAPTTPARINHVVLFSLKNPADADALVADSRESLGAIPSVTSIFCGKHVDAGRPGVMTDYDACVYVGFDSLESYSDYVAHPRHQELVARWKDRLIDYRVYDVLDESAR